VVKGTDFREHLTLFQSDPETQAIVLLGEIGGSDEENAAAFIRDTAITKPVVAFVSGRSVPPGQTMGHAGAIAERGRGDYQSKCSALVASGVHVAQNIGEIPRLLKLSAR
jgi:succinyl-CoA synthetase alpha subunit